MCLTIDVDKTEKLKNSTDRVVTRYKVIKTVAMVNCDPFSHSYPIYFHRSPVISEFIWNSGINLAVKSPITSYLGEIRSGAIHVFTNRKDAEKYLEQEFSFMSTPDFWFNIVEVQCNIDDLVAVGTFLCSSIRYSSEAYTKVYVEKLPDNINKIRCIS